MNLISIHCPVNMQEGEKRNEKIKRDEHAPHKD